MNKLRAIRWIFLCVGIGACAGRSDRPQGSDELFYHAQLLLERSQYLDAIVAFEGFRDAHPGSRFVDGAIYGLGRAHYEEGEYLVASVHFGRIVDDFPDSAYRSAARYQLGRCFDALANDAALDQGYTLRAIEQYSLYQVEYPAGDDLAAVDIRMVILRNRLAEKEVRTGEFYLRRGRAEAALLYLDRVVERFEDTGLFQRARLARAQALVLLDRADEARKILVDLAGGNDEVAEGARESLEQLRQSGGEAG